MAGCHVEPSRSALAMLDWIEWDRHGQRLNVYFKIVHCEILAKILMHYATATLSLRPCSFQTRSRSRGQRILIGFMRPATKGMLWHSDLEISLQVISPCSRIYCTKIVKSFDAMLFLLGWALLVI